MVEIYENNTAVLTSYSESLVGNRILPFYILQGILQAREYTCK